MGMFYCRYMVIAVDFTMTERYCQIFIKKTSVYISHVYKRHLLKEAHFYGSAWTTKKWVVFIEKDKLPTFPQNNSEDVLSIVVKI